ncbi:MAG TPA: sigma-70 family RNA polymerase sigma factor [Gemmatimonadaceae bacterium]|nr:sigma-70 family RNA polymerase sigma factor [Gemmatimonadaceae bacterium]
MTVHALLRVIDDHQDEDLPRLVNEVKAGVPGAFERLARSVEERVRGWARRVTVDHDEADDVTQDVLIKLERVLQGFAGTSRFSTWLYRVTRNAALERRRREERHAGPSVDSLVRGRTRERALVVQAAPDTVDHTALTRVVLECFDSLPRRQRQVFELADLRGYTPTEIAKCLAMKPVTVRAHLFKARRTIRTRMLEQHPDLVKEYFT